MRRVSRGRGIGPFGGIEHMSIFGYILMVIGVVAWIVGDIMYLNATYRRGLGWFFGGMFLPLVDWIFLFAHWRVAYRPFVLSLGGLALAIAREGVHRSGKIELLFGEIEKPLPFRQHQLTDVRHVGDKAIRTEVATAAALDGWAQYADLQLLACIAQTNKPAAREHREAAMRMWDGNGFRDAATEQLQRYSTYKLGLALLAASRLPSAAELPDGFLDRLLPLQDDSGGWITDHDAQGNPIGLANVETTCRSILGIEAFVARGRFPGDEMSTEQGTRANSPPGSPVAMNCAIIPSSQSREGRFQRGARRWRSLKK
jgi:hypothetical protein